MAQNQERKAVLFNRFNRGLASGLKSRRTGSFFFGYGLDIHEDESYLKVLPRTMKDWTSNIQYPGTVLSRWPLTEYSGNAADAVGANTLTDNATVGNDTADRILGNNSRDFEFANSEFFSITDAAQTGLDFAGSFTLAGWFKFETVGTQQTLISKHDGASQRSYVLYKETTDKLSFNMSSNGTSNAFSINGATTLVANTWYHLAVVFTASTRCELFVNGVPDGNETAGIPAAAFNSTASFRIGHQEGQSTYFDGKANDVAVWAAALTESQISKLYGDYTLIKNLTIDAVRVKNGDTYFLDIDGNVTRRTTAGVWSIIDKATYMPYRSDIKGHWKLDETTAGATRADTSGNSQTLTDNATVQVNAHSQRQGAAAATFEAGSSQYLSLADNATMSLTGAITISCWVNLESLAERTFVAKWNESGNQRAYRLWVDSSNKLSFSVSSNGTAVTTVTGATSLATNTWYHVVGRYIPSKRLEVFINGATDATNTTSIPSAMTDTTAVFTIGAKLSAAGAAETFMDGSIDDVVIWGRALSAVEIDRVYDGYTNGGQGLFYWEQKDTLYVTSDHSVSGYGPVTGTPTFTEAKYGVITDATITTSGNAGITYPNTGNRQGWWKLNESSGDRADSSGNGITLTDNNTVASSTDAKEGGRSADFETANSESLTAADPAALDITGAMTIAFWYKPENVTVDQFLVSKYNETGNQVAYWVQLLSTAKIRFGVSDGASDTVDSATSLVAGTWYHIACIYNPSTHIRIVINGVQDAENTTTINATIQNTTAEFAIGTGTVGGARSSFADGLIDDVVIWNTNVAVADILTLYNSYTNTYTVPTSVSEDSADKFSYTPRIDPLEGIVVNVNATGAGDWTVTLHDDNNNTIGTSTLVNTALTTGDNVFTFDPPLRVQKDGTYHFHINSTAGSGSVTVGASLTPKSMRLVDTRSGAHPMTDFTTFLAICNERYLSTFDGLLDAPTDSDNTETSSYTIHKLTLPAGYEQVCVAKFDEYIVAGCEYRGANPEDHTRGLLVFWDGTSASFNFFVEVHEGGVFWLLPIKNSLYFGAGLVGEVFLYAGGDYVKVKRLPKTSTKKYVRSTWGCATIYQGLPTFGYSRLTDSADFHSGAYTWGSRDGTSPDALNFAWPISTGTLTGTTLQIGMTKGFGTDLFIGWRDGSSYGIDIVEPTNNPFPTAVIESLANDERKPWHIKYVRTIRVDHQALPAGGTIRVDHKIDQASSFSPGNENSTDDDTFTREPINKEFKDLEHRVVIGSTTTSPQINCITEDIEPREGSEVL